MLTNFVHPHKNTIELQWEFTELNQRGTTLNDLLQLLPELEFNFFFKIKVTQQIACLLAR